MTRINVVPVEELCDQHLNAEYRELLRVFSLAHSASLSKKPWTNRQPANYTMGTGHVLFFYDKLMFLAIRHKQIVQEMINRGFKPKFTDCLYEQWCSKLPVSYWKNYTPTVSAIEINRARINERLSGMKNISFKVVSL